MLIVIMFYVGIFGFMVVVIVVFFGVWWGKLNVFVGYGGDVELELGMWCYVNFVEVVFLVLIFFGLIEMNGVLILGLYIFGGVFVVFWIVYGVGMKFDMV